MTAKGTLIEIGNPCTMVIFIRRSQSLDQTYIRKRGNDMHFLSYGQWTILLFSYLTTQPGDDHFSVSFFLNNYIIHTRVKRITHSNLQELKECLLYWNNFAVKGISSCSFHPEDGLAKGAQDLFLLRHHLSSTITNAHRHPHFSHPSSHPPIVWTCLQSCF